MDYSTELFDTRDLAKGLYVDFDGADVRTEGISVYQYYWMEDDLMLLTRHEEVQVDTDAEQILAGVGDATLRIDLPSGLVAEMERKLAENVHEKTF